MKVFRKFGGVVFGTMAVVAVAVLVITVTTGDDATAWEEGCWAAYDSARSARDTQLVDIRVPKGSLDHPDAAPPTLCGDVRENGFAQLRHDARASNPSVR